MGFFSTLTESALDALFPRRCPLCGTVIAPNQRICGKCSDNVIYINPPVCRLCGRNTFDCVCDDRPRHYERCVSPFVYTKAARNGIHRLKFQRGASSAPYFGSFMAQTVSREYRDEKIDLIVSVPMHREDISRRGYNQSALLADSVGKTLDIPVRNNVLLKRRHNNAQHSLSRAERQQNVQDAFEVSRSYLVSGRTILICDDVITTGSTLDECARILLAAGARKVLCVTAAAVVGAYQSNAKRAYV